MPQNNKMKNNNSSASIFQALYYFSFLIKYLDIDRCISYAIKLHFLYPFI